jgi:hypothetical protein
MFNLHVTILLMPALSMLQAIVLPIRDLGSERDEQIRKNVEFLDIQKKVFHNGESGLGEF